MGFLRTPELTEEMRSWPEERKFEFFEESVRELVDFLSREKDSNLIYAAKLNFYMLQSAFDWSSATFDDLCIMHGLDPVALKPLEPPYLP
jgi:hypothetical protein